MDGRPMRAHDAPAGSRGHEWCSGAMLVSAQERGRTPRGVRVDVGVDVDMDVGVEVDRDPADACRAGATGDQMGPEVRTL